MPEPGLFQEQVLQRVHGVPERVDVGNPSQPHRKSFDWIDGAGGKEKQRVEHSENCARHQRVAHAHHHQKHEADHGDRSADQYGHQINQADGVPDPRDAGDQSSDDGYRRARHEPLERSG